MFHECLYCQIPYSFVGYGLNVGSFMIYCVQGEIIIETIALHRYIYALEGLTNMSKHPENSVVGICEGSQSNNVVWFMHLCL